MIRRCCIEGCLNILEDGHEQCFVHEKVSALLGSVVLLRMNVHQACGLPANAEGHHTGDPDCRCAEMRRLIDTFFEGARG